MSPLLGKRVFFLSSSTLCPFSLVSRRLHQQFESYKEQVRKIGEEARRYQGEHKDDAPTCGICHKTKFADGCGHLCSYCRTKFCARCGGRVSLRSNNVSTRGRERPASLSAGGCAPPAPSQRRGWVMQKSHKRCCLYVCTSTNDCHSKPTGYLWEQICFLKKVGNLYLVPGIMKLLKVVVASSCTKQPNLTTYL